MSERNHSSRKPSSGSFRPRRSRRSQNHDDVHSNLDNEATPVIPDHPLVPQGDAELIEDQQGVDAFVEHIREAGVFAYDTEFIGELTYYPHLCLVQVGTAERVGVIDSLCDIDLTPVWELIADPSIETLVHAGQQDLEPVVRLINKAPANIVDMQIAAGFIGLPYPVGLGSLIESLVGVQLGKRLTFTHWDKRPLGDHHIRYAADDVRYLLAVREGIGERLETYGNAAYAAEECQAVCDASLYMFNADTQYMRVKGWKDLKPRQLAILKAITTLRDSLAREHDVPPRSLMKDDVLTRLSKEPVRDPAKLDRVRNLPRPIIEQYGGRLVDIIVEALATPAEDRPEPIRIDDSAEQRVATDSLWAATANICLGQGVDPTLVCSRSAVAQLVYALKRGKGLEGSPLESGWRRKLLGDALVEFYHGQRQLTTQWKDGHLVTDLGKALGDASSGE